MPQVRFDARPIPTLLVLLACAGMTALGFWQLHRGQAKAALIAQHQRALEAPAVPLMAAGAAGEPRKVFAEGHYSETPGVLQDNQSHAHAPGVAVWNAFVLEDGSQVLVNRGWAPLVRGEPPALPPPPAESRRIEGLWHPLPVAPMRLGGAPPPCAPGAARPRTVQYPGIAELRCLYGVNLREGLLDLAPGQPDGYTRESAVAAAEAVPPARHYGYAAQWWAFAATLAVLFLKISIRKS